MKRSKVFCGMIKAALLLAAAFVLLLAAAFVLLLTVCMDARAEVDPDSGLTYEETSHTETVFSYKLGIPVSADADEFQRWVTYRFRVIGRTPIRMTFTAKGEGSATIELAKTGTGFGMWSRIESVSCAAGESISMDWTIDPDRFGNAIRIYRDRNSRISYEMKVEYGESDEPKATDFTLTPEQVELQCFESYILNVEAKDRGIARYTFAVSDPKMLSVDELGKVTVLQKTGQSRVFCTLNGTVTKSCLFKVSKSPRQKAPELYNQMLAWCNKIEVPFDANSHGIYEIYRSKKKNGKYTKVKTIKKYEDKGISNTRYFVQKRLKPNTNYYYKVRVKREGTDFYSDFSGPKSYWTSPEPKVKGLKNGMTRASWKKVKGVTGYAVDETYTAVKGYNIFGQTVMVTNTTTFFQKSNSFRKRYTTRYTAQTLPSELKVRTYAKHGKKYYMHGTLVENRKYYYSNTGGHTYAY